MANPIVHPEAEYKIAQVGPTRDWDFTGNDGAKIAMRTYSIQFEGVADWVDLNTKSDGDAPKVGETLEGHIEDGGKYGYKFVKKKKGGSWGGSKGNMAGAAWSAALGTASTLVQGYFVTTGSKPKSFDEYFARVEAVAKKVKETVDALAKATPAESAETPKTESESGESPAPANQPIQLDTISEDELGKW